jgi:hypothetical protein
MRLIKLKQALLQVTALVFVMNAAAAFGACCFSLPDELSGSESIVATTQPPCHKSHQSADKPDNSAAQDDCCLLCAPMMGAPDIQRKLAQSTHIIPTHSSITFLVGGVDPPYRPPISNLS